MSFQFAPALYLLIRSVHFPTLNLLINRKEKTNKFALTVLTPERTMAVTSVISELFTVLAAEDFWLVEEAQTLERTLKTVEAMLDDAEKRQLKDSGVNRWLDQLKDAFYEADDLLDGLKTEILRLKIMEDVAGKTPVLKKKVLFMKP